MNEIVVSGEALARARKAAGFSQDEVALLLGQPRPVISNWEKGKRRPSDFHLQRLSTVYRVEVSELLAGPALPRPDFERLIFRDAGDRIDARGKYEIQAFLAFLDEYADFLDAMGEEAGLRVSPFSVSEAFSAKEDVRRRAEDARSYFGLGGGPVGDLVALADLRGMTVYQAPLGGDLATSVSGAFFPHSRVGFSILLNTQTTPGRRMFTLAHEIAHALFHGDHVYVNYPGRREAEERFAHEFAAEFLVPAKSLRAVAELLGTSRVTDAEVVVHIQRLFGVSYQMMLTRLLSTGLVEPHDLEHLRGVRPVHLAASLGYEPAPDEWGQDRETWGLARFPPRLLRLLRRAFQDGRMTLGGAAALTGAAEDEIERFLADRRVASDEDQDFEYLRTSA